MAETYAQYKKIGITDVSGTERDITKFVKSIEETEIMGFPVIVSDLIKVDEIIMTDWNQYIKVKIRIT